MKPQIENSRFYLVFLGVFIGYFIRWVVSLGVAWLAYWLVSERTFTLFSDVKNDSEYLLPWISPGEFAGDLANTGFIISASFIANAGVSACLILLLARAGNRFWAFLLLLLTPFFVMGALAGLSPLSASLTNNRITYFALVVDFVSVCFIAWRLYINRSPFAGIDREQGFTQKKSVGIKSIS